MVFIGNFRPFVKRDKFVGFPGINDPYTGHVLLDVMSQFQGYGQCNVLLARMFSRCPGIFSAMSGIDDHSGYFHPPLCG